VIRIVSFNQSSYGTRHTNQPTDNSWIGVFGWLGLLCKTRAKCGSNIRVTMFASLCFSAFALY